MAGMQPSQSDTAPMEGLERRRKVCPHLGHSTGWKGSERQLGSQIARRSVEGHERTITIDAAVVGGDEVGMHGPGHALVQGSPAAPALPDRLQGPGDASRSGQSMILGLVHRE
jgi:hypothetical protein